MSTLNPQNVLLNYVTILFVPPIYSLGFYYSPFLVSSAIPCQSFSLCVYTSVLWCSSHSPRLPDVWSACPPAFHLFNTQQYIYTAFSSAAHVWSFVKLSTSLCLPLPTHLHFLKPYNETFFHSLHPCICLLCLGSPIVCNRTIWLTWTQGTWTPSTKRSSLKDLYWDSMTKISRKLWRTSRLCPLTSHRLVTRWAMFPHTSRSTHLEFSLGSHYS